MIIFGLGARQIVDWSRLPWKRWGTPGLRITQQGSWAQWYQERPIAKRPLSQMTCEAISTPTRVRPDANSAAWTPACQTDPTVRLGTGANVSDQSTRVSPESVVL